MGGSGGGGVAQRQSFCVMELCSEGDPLVDLEKQKQQDFLRQTALQEVFRSNVQHYSSWWSLNHTNSFVIIAYTC